MSDKQKKRELVGPWRNLHAAVWLIGLAIIFWMNWWWPGILVLVAVSLLVEGALMQFAPRAYAVPAVEVLPPILASAPAPEHRLELLPAACPNCGGPIRGKDLKWTGPQSADCPYCGANLPMRAQPEAKPG